MRITGRPQAVSGPAPNGAPALAAPPSKKVERRSATVVHHDVGLTAMPFTSPSTFSTLPIAVAQSVNGSAFVAPAVCTPENCRTPFRCGRCPHR